MIESLACRTSARRRCRLGIVGGGLIAQLAHLPVLRRLGDRFRVVALADPSARVRDALRRRYGSPRDAGHARAARARSASTRCSSARRTGPTRAVDARRARRRAARARREAAVPRAGRRRRDRRGGAARAARRPGRVHEALRRPPTSALLERCRRPMPLRGSTRMTVDPGIGAALPPGRLRRGHRRRRRARAALADATRAQVAAAVGSTTRATPRRTPTRSSARSSTTSTSCSACSTRLGRRAWTASSTRPRRADGSLASCVLALDGGARWSAAWLLRAAARRALRASELRAAFDRRLPRRSRSPRPYADAVATLRAPARALPRLRRGTATRAARRPSRARATSSCSPRRTAAPDAAEASQHERRGDRHRLGLGHRPRRRRSRSRAPGHDVGITWHTRRGGRATRPPARSAAQGARRAVARLDLTDRPRRGDRRSSRPSWARSGASSPARAPTTARALARRRARRLAARARGQPHRARSCARRPPPGGSSSAARGGRIVFVTSVHEHVPLRFAAAYAAAKAGLGMAAQVMALELAAPRDHRQRGRARATSPRR